MPKLTAPQIFTPSDFPTYTYVERNGADLERRLSDALGTPGEIISISGPSKSGKTVLIERVVGVEQLIPVTGARISDPDSLWTHILDWMDAPASRSTSIAKTSSVGTEGKLSGTLGIAVLAGISGEGSANLERGTESSEEESRERHGMTQVVREIGNSPYVVLIDDYHYMRRDVQSEVAKQIKEAARLGVKFCTASVPHRADDVVRSNPELRGRIRAIDVGYWTRDDLAKIPETGFSHLNATISKSTVDAFTRETSGSPQLMQAVCLQACFELGLREEASTRRSLDPNDNEARGILRETATRTDFSTLVADLHSGPKTRGTERKEFVLFDGSAGDVYRTVLMAIAHDPVRLSFPYNELYNRIQAVSPYDVPQAASIYQACSQMAQIAEARSPTERIVEWDEERSVLEIVDPYLLFYLRWSTKLDSMARA